MKDKQKTARGVMGNDDATSLERVSGGQGRKNVNIGIAEQMLAFCSIYNISYHSRGHDRSRPTLGPTGKHFPKQLYILNNQTAMPRSIWYSEVELSQFPVRRISQPRIRNPRWLLHACNSSESCSNMLFLTPLPICDSLNDCRTHNAVQLLPVDILLRFLYAQNAA